MAPLSDCPDITENHHDASQCMSLLSTTNAYVSFYSVVQQCCIISVISQQQLMYKAPVVQTSSNFPGVLELSVVAYLPPGFLKVRPPEQTPFGIKQTKRSKTVPESFIPLGTHNYRSV